jgi:hypothetical protein
MIRDIQVNDGVERSNYRAGELPGILALPGQPERRTVVTEHHVRFFRTHETASARA